MFATFNDDAPSLDDFLGDMRFISTPSSTVILTVSR